VLKQRLRLILLCILLWLPFSGAAADEPSDRLTQQMTLNQQRYGIAGQAVQVLHNGRLLFRGSLGQADLETGRHVARDSVFPVYSLSKLFASTLVMQLVEQGEVELDKPARSYMPDLPQRWSGITVRQLLNHSSGLPEYFTDAQMAGTTEANASFAANLGQVFAALADKPFLFAAGSDTRYTQTNYLVLLQLLETHYGKPYAEIAAARIIRKLGLRHTWLGRDKLPRGVVTAYLGKDGQLQKQPSIAWPPYALGHADLYASAGDLAIFLQALASGQLVGKAALQQLWQPQTLSSGRRGGFASGWEYGESGAYRLVGHDGGARVRVRILYKDSLDGDVYIVIYLSSGSVRNVWSRTLVDSLLANLAPQAFPAEALSERLIAFALQSPDETATQSFATTLRSDGTITGQLLERAINNSGYAIRANLGAAAALPVFTVNTLLFPQSANTWDSLAEAYEANGDTANAQAIRRKAGAPVDASR
jgi:CubicO group peptidase (beta-lactamase class C family)